jgi:hypothetical protein
MRRAFLTRACTDHHSAAFRGNVFIHLPINRTNHSRRMLYPPVQFHYEFGSESQGGQA